MKIIVGLGNPGKSYENTRHNAGWIVLDALQKEFKAEAFKTEKKFKSQISKAEFNGDQLLLVKPLTYMNLSGEGVGPIAKFYKIDPQNIIAIYDDLDTPFGNIRIRKKGSAGTHNGMKSLVQQLGENFPRIRIGIESRLNKDQDTASFVLSPFKKDEKATLKESLNRAVGAVKTILSKDLNTAMNNYNSA